MPTDDQNHAELREQDPNMDLIAEERQHLDPIRIHVVPDDTVDPNVWHHINGEISRFTAQILNDHGLLGEITTIDEPEGVVETRVTPDGVHRDLKVTARAGDTISFTHRIHIDPPLEATTLVQRWLTEHDQELAARSFDSDSPNSYEDIRYRHYREPTPQGPEVEEVSDQESTAHCSICAE